MPFIYPQLATLAKDIKLSHSIFALPFALLSTFMAAGGWPDPIALGLIIVCMVSARTVAMGANRVLDAKLDRLNPRTANRAIPAGKLSVRFYLMVMFFSSFVFALATSGFWHLDQNPWPARLAVPVLIFICIYPLLKRFTRWCHYYLGIALGLAPVCAWVAIAGNIAPEPAILGLAVLCWTAGFDILYACQDYQSDLQTRIHSVPAGLGIARALTVAKLTHIISWLLLVALWWYFPPLSTWFAIGVLIAGALLLYEHSLVRADDLSRLNIAFFTLNGLISCILGLCGIIDVLTAGAG